MDSLEVLILAGGRSSRMGSPKHLLALPDGALYHHLIRSILGAIPDVSTVHISITRTSVLDEPLRQGTIIIPNRDLPNSTLIKLTSILDNDEHDIGPAAGLVAAHILNPTATWIVIACDYPLIESATINQLVTNYKAPITCFKNAEGFTEPLLSIWSPDALEDLMGNVENNRTGPSYTVKRTGGTLIKPDKEIWLTNVNTKEEWDITKRSLQEVQPEIS